jgi:hypothetical protein
MEMTMESLLAQTATATLIRMQSHEEVSHVRGPADDKDSGSVNQLRVGLLGKGEQAETEAR